MTYKELPAIKPKTTTDWDTKDTINQLPKTKINNQTVITTAPRRIENQHQARENTCIITMFMQTLSTKINHVTYVGENARNYFLGGGKPNQEANNLTPNRRYNHRFQERRSTQPRYM